MDVSGRQLTRPIRHREFHLRAFSEWQEVTCAQSMAKYYMKPLIG
jgi:hypothetical protein